MFTVKFCMHLKRKLDNSNSHSYLRDFWKIAVAVDRESFFRNLSNCKEMQEALLKPRKSQISLSLYLSLSLFLFLFLFISLSLSLSLTHSLSLFLTLSISHSLILSFSYPHSHSFSLSLTLTLILFLLPSLYFFLYITLHISASFSGPFFNRFTGFSATFSPPTHFCAWLVKPTTFLRRPHRLSQNSGKSSHTFLGHAGLPDFSWYNIPKREKLYQMTTKCTKRS
jgi:hypothetical protein